MAPIRIVNLFLHPWYDVCLGVYMYQVGGSSVAALLVRYAFVHKLAVAGPQVQQDKEIFLAHFYTSSRGILCSTFHPWYSPPITPPSP